MPAGEMLRYRVGFYQRGSAGGGGSPPPPDYGSGGSYPSTATFITYGNIEPRLGGEEIMAGRLTGKNFVNITVRKDTDTIDVDTDWKCKDEDTGEEYNIRSVVDPSQGRVRHGMYLELLCEKGGAVV